MPDVATVGVPGTVSERVSRLEGAYHHLATKSDLQAAINTLTWRLIGAFFLGLAALGAFLRLTGS